MYWAVPGQNGIFTHQNDIDTPFLNGVLEEEVYVYPPLAIQAVRGQVLKLNRRLYGLKQEAATCFKTVACVFVEISPYHVWQNHASLSSILNDLGFTLHCMWMTFLIGA